MRLELWSQLKLPVQKHSFRCVSRFFLCFLLSRRFRKVHIKFVALVNCFATQWKRSSHVAIRFCNLGFRLRNISSNFSYLNWTEAAMYLQYFRLGLLVSLAFATPNPVNPSKPLSNFTNRHSGYHAASLDRFPGEQRASTGQNPIPALNKRMLDELPILGTSDDACIYLWINWQPITDVHSPTNAIATYEKRIPVPQNAQSSAQSRINVNRALVIRTTQKKKLCPKDCRICGEGINQHCDKCPLPCADSQCPCFPNTVCDYAEVSCQKVSLYYPSSRFERYQDSLTQFNEPSTSKHVVFLPLSTR